MKQLTATLFIFILLSHTVIADDKNKDKRIYQVSFDTLWTACINTALDMSFSLTASDKESGLLTFDRGSTFTSNPFTIGLFIKREAGEQTSVRVNVQNKSGPYLLAGSQKNKLRKKYFEALEKQLSAESKP